MIEWVLGAAMATAAAEPVDLQGFQDEVAEAMLAGEALPVDYATRLSEMAPAERIEMIVFLRRVGMMKGPTWTVDDLLRPAEKGK